MGVLLLLLACVLMCAFKFVLLLSLFCFLFVLFFNFVCFFVFGPRKKCSFNMGGGRVKLQSSTGQKINFSYFGIVYTFEV